MNVSVDGEKSEIEYLWPQDKYFNHRILFHIGGVSKMSWSVYKQ